jgi:hypothetical protein
LFLAINVEVHSKALISSRWIRLQKVIQCIVSRAKVCLEYIDPLFQIRFAVLENQFFDGQGLLFKIVFEFLELGVIDGLQDLFGGHTKIIKSSLTKFI